METNSDTERKIIQAATGVFLQKGKDGARMQEIADQAGINKALLHYYFRSKDRLYDEVFIRQLHTFFAGILEAITDKQDFKAFLQFFIHHYVDTVAENKNLVRFILWDIEKGGEKIRTVILESMREKGLRHQIIIERIQHAVERKQIRQVDPINLMMSLIGACLFPFVAKPVLENIFEDLDITSPKFLKQRKQEIFDLVWNGIAQ